MGCAPNVYQNCEKTMSKTATTTIDPSEIAKFEAMAEEWWDESGKFAPLHKFNPVRIDYIRNVIDAKFGKMDGISLLDIGCGGGLLAEPLTRLGAHVTAIDASEKNITIASVHAEKSGLSIDYQATTAEALAAKGEQFDVVLSMEVVEHVADVETFLNATASLVKPGGMLIVATLNRTIKSFAFAIVGAEYVLRWLPRGTHDWKKFLKPSEIEAILRDTLTLKESKGASFNPLSNSWSLSNDLSINYMMRFEKDKG